MPSQHQPAAITFPVFCRNAAYKSAACRSSAVQGKLGASRNHGVLTMTYTLQPAQKTKRGRQCPDCGASLVKRSSMSKHPLLSRTFLICRNPVCGATFLGVDEITHRLSPSSQPNPAVALPYAPSALRRAALDDLEQHVDVTCAGQIEGGAA